MFIQILKSTIIMLVCMTDIIIYYYNACARYVI